MIIFWSFSYIFRNEKNKSEWRKVPQESRICGLYCFLRPSSIFVLVQRMSQSLAKFEILKLLNCSALIWRKNGEQAHSHFKHEPRQISTIIWRPDTPESFIIDLTKKMANRLCCTHSHFKPEPRKFSWQNEIKFQPNSSSYLAPKATRSSFDQTPPLFRHRKLRKPWPKL